jgi:hypothetical protein
MGQHTFREQVDCAFFGDLDFRFTYPDWLLLSAIYQQWFSPSSQQTEDKEKKKESGKLLSKH